MKALIFAGRVKHFVFITSACACQKPPTHLILAADPV
jgi:hypothetical protein